MSGLSGLRSVRFGAFSFTEIIVVQRLTSLTIGSSWLSQLQWFPLDSLKSLQSLRIGCDWLRNLHSLEVISQNPLDSMSIGAGSFSGVE